MTRNKRRHKTGFGYIGAGNDASVFNRKPKQVFSKLKNELNSKSDSEFKLKFTDVALSEADKAKIKNNIRSKNRRKNIQILILSVIIVIPIIFGIIALIEGVILKYK